MGTSRTRGRSYPIATGDRLYTPIQPPGTPIVETTVTTFDRSETCEDVVTPGYRELIAQGAIINNPCSIGVSHLELSDGSLRYYRPSPLSEYTYTGVEITGLYLQKFTSTEAPQVELDASAERAKLMAISQLSSTPFAFGEDLLEIGETLRFLRSPFKSMADLAKSFQTKRNDIRSKYKRVEDQAKALADVWATYRFAFSPLIRSSMDAWEAATTKPVEPPKRLTARGFSTDSQTEHVLEYVPSGLWTGSVYYSHELQASVHHHASILYTVTNPLTGLSYRLGVRIKDLPKTLWQVFPLSFMVDRVWDLSNSIGGLTGLADPNISILAGSIRTKSNEERRLRLESVLHPDYTITGSGDQVYTKYFTYTRTPWRPSVSDTVPQVRTKGIVEDVTKILDLAAILIQRLTGSK